MITTDKNMLFLFMISMENMENMKKKIKKLCCKLGACQPTKIHSMSFALE